MRQYALLWVECDSDINDDLKLIPIGNGNVLAVVETDEDLDLEAENIGVRDSINGDVEYIIQVKETDYIPNLKIIKDEESVS